MFIVAVQILCSITGIAATVRQGLLLHADPQIVGFGMMLTPALDMEGNSLLDVQVGCVARAAWGPDSDNSWGQVCTIATTIMFSVLGVCFYNESKAAVDEW